MATTRVPIYRWLDGWFLGQLDQQPYRASALLTYFALVFLSENLRLSESIRSKRSVHHAAHPRYVRLPASFLRRAINTPRSSIQFRMPKCDWRRWGSERRHIFKRQCWLGVCGLLYLVHLAELPNNNCNVCGVLYAYIFSRSGIVKRMAWEDRDKPQCIVLSSMSSGFGACKPTSTGRCWDLRQFNLFSMSR